MTKLTGQDVRAGMVTKSYFTNEYYPELNHTTITPFGSAMEHVKPPINHWRKPKLPKRFRKGV